VHTGRANGTTYYYSVSAVNGIGEGSLSMPEVSATPMPTVGAPGVPMNLRGCGDNMLATITWDAVQDATTYNVYGKQGTGVNFGDLIMSGVGAPTYTDLNLTNGQTFSYAVTATNTAGTSALSAEISIPLTPLPAPQNVSAASGSNQNTISWDAVNCADSYIIFWNTTGNVSSSDNQILVPDPASTQYNHMGAVPGTTYYYVIATVNGLGQGNISSPEVSATPIAGPLPVGIGAGEGAGTPASCAVMNDGTLKCWGGNPGDGSPFSATPVTVPGITAATAVSIADEHTCAIDGGAVKCWGAGTFGQLGQGANASSTTPVQAVGLTAATAIAAGNDFTCAIENQAVWCWGTGLGLGNYDPTMGTYTNSNVPIPVNGLPSTASTLSVARVSARACSLLGNLEVWCWGLLPGYLGSGGAGCDTFNQCQPVISPVPGGVGVVTDVVLGAAHACFLITNATAAVDCEGGAMGDTFDTLTSNLSFTLISAGEDFYCGISAGGIASCWGWNGDGQLGDGTNTIHPFSTAVPVSGVGNASDISAGFTHACAVDGGVVKCWGTVTGGPAPVIIQGL
jgi:fibronectin type 3 domain-containing protein